jgi:phenylacetic acid degradation operon negative regulatory protein
MTEAAWRATARRLGVRPLSARSVVLSTLLGSHPPTRSGPSLVAVGELFGIPAGTVRVALSRLVADGELVGRDGVFDLAESFSGRQSMLDAGRLARRGRWDGTWWTVIALSERRALAERRAFRSAMSAALLGELRPDVWLRPANLPVALGDDELMLSRGERSGEDGRRLVARLWDLPALRARLDLLCGEAERAIALLAAGDRAVLAETFVISVAITRELGAEPQLPAELVGEDWPADDLRARYDLVARRHGRTLGAVLDEAHI